MTIKKLTAIVLTGALLLLTACSDSDSGSGKKARRKTTTPLAKLGQLMDSGRLPSRESRKRLSAMSMRTKNLQRSTSWTTNIQTSVTRTRTA